MAATKNCYFGTTGPLPRLTALRAGNLACAYESGGLRHIRQGGLEIANRIYVAVRDPDWATVAGRVVDEKITRRKNSFLISYACVYEQGDIRYQTQVRIEGKPDSTIVFSVRGRALGRFLRNRIGICVLHPVQTCTGKSCTVTRPDGSEYEARFPESISPHQPFTNVRRMRWQPAANAEAELVFEGETFETEDQRNWTDHSFKTYGTPLGLPFPVLVEEGEKLFQRVVLKWQATGSYCANAEEPAAIAVTGDRRRLPSIGYGRPVGRELLTQNELSLLRNVPLGHYRVQIRFGTGWQAEFNDACAEAAQLNTKLEVAVFFSDAYTSEFAVLLPGLSEKRHWSAMS